MIARALGRHLDTFVSGLVYGAGLMVGVLAGIYLWHVLDLPTGWVFAVRQ
jgi:hypothetical protein